MKKCTICKQEKFKSEFNKNRAKKDGLNDICRLCSQEKSRKYYKDNCEKHKKEIFKRKQRCRAENQKWIADYLSLNSCVDCGESDIVVLEFDHIKDVKRLEISLMMRNNYSLKTIKKEIEKCEVRCANCHKRKTAKEQNWYKFKYSIKNKINQK